MDAFARLAHPLDAVRLVPPGGAVALAQSAWSPFNSQNTTVWRCARTRSAAAAVSDASNPVAGCSCNDRISPNLNSDSPLALIGRPWMRIR